MDINELEIEIYEAEHQPQLEELWLYGNFNGSQDDDSGWDGE